MIRNSYYRRILVAVLLLLGGVMMFLAPSSPPGYWTGVVFILVGIVIETIGIAMAHKDRESR
ncbi:MAG: hypothetical protein P8164_08515 [Gammaproteobacteria bacterium]|jgi:drug/metabolite transporter (DMT)-like permease